MIECVTYRLRMHTTADDPKRFRKEETILIGKGQKLREGDDLTMISYGAMVRPTLEAASELKE